MTIARGGGVDGRNAGDRRHFSREIAEIGQWQGGHVTTEQLCALGLSRHAVAHRVAQGNLIRVYRGVYAVGHLPSTPHDKAHGALLATGDGSGLAGWVALALWRKDRDWPERLELVSPLDRRPKGLIVHQTKTLLGRDIRRVQGLRVTSPARTTLDLAARVGEQQLTRIANDLRHTTRLQVHELRDVASRNPYHPGTKPLLNIIGIAQKQPTRSELENAFLRLCRRHKLPTPQVNLKLGGEDVDAYFPDHQLIVELDGREKTHADDWRPAFENDRARVVRVMAKTGIPTIRFTWDQITRLHTQTAAQLDTILKARLKGGQRP